MDYIAVATPDTLERHCPGGFSAHNFRDLPFIAFNRKDDLQSEFVGRLFASGKFIFASVSCRVPKARYAQCWLAGAPVSYRNCWFAPARQRATHQPQPVHPPAGQSLLALLESRLALLNALTEAVIAEAAHSLKPAT